MSLSNRIRRLKRELFGWVWPTQGPPEPESAEEQIYAAVIREGDVVFDIGANVGAVSLFLARHTGPTGVVVAFEPIWSVYARLCRTVQNHRSSRAPILTLPYGLAETDRAATLHIPNGVFEMASLADAKPWIDAHGGAPLVESSCSVRSLDAFMNETQVTPPQFMKIDVEGAELLVLRGASRFFAAGHRPLMLIEIFAPWERAFGYDPWDVLSLLSSLRYEFLFVCPEGLVEYTPVPSAPFPPEFENGYNVVAFVGDTHRDRLTSLSPFRVGGPASRFSIPPPPRPNRYEPGEGSS